MPSISIIIPVYNVAPYLCECLDSVIAQTFSDWEAICINDGSTDGSADLLDAYAAMDTRFKVIHQKNAGVSVARNRALQLALGEWIAFLDPDDWVSPSLYAEALTNVSEEVDIVGYAVSHIDENGMYVGARPKFTHAVMKGDELLRHTDDEYKGFQSCGWDKMYRRKLIEGRLIRFNPDISYCEDVLFTELSLFHARLVELRPTTGSYHYRNRVFSASKNFTTEKRIDLLKVGATLIDIYLSNNPRPKGLGRSIASKLQPLVEGLFSKRPDIRKYWLSALAGSKHLCPNIFSFLLWNGKVKYRVAVWVYLYLPKTLQLLFLR